MNSNTPAKRGGDRQLFFENAHLNKIFPSDYIGRSVTRINRTHLFRMNIDLRAMEAEAEDLRAQMRDVLTRKLGKPRKVDRTLDDLLRQMARRHKYALSYGTLPHVIAQLRTWSVRTHTTLNTYLSL